MIKRVWMVGALVCFVGAFATTASLNAQQRGGRGNGGWNLPANAETEKNPLTVNDAVVAVAVSFVIVTSTIWSIALPMVVSYMVKVPAGVSTVSMYVASWSTIWVDVLISS